MLHISRQIWEHDWYAKLSNVSPWQEVAWLVTEGGLSIKLTGRGFYGENVFQITSQGDLSVKPIITLSMFTYKQWQ